MSIDSSWPCKVQAGVCAAEVLCAVRSVESHLCRVCVCVCQSVREIGASIYLFLEGLPDGTVMLMAGLRSAVARCGVCDRKTHFYI